MDTLNEEKILPNEKTRILISPYFLPITSNI